MAVRSGDTIWELVEQAANTLPEPFSRSALIGWVAQRRTDVETTSISTHIHYAIAGTPNRERHPLGARSPFLERVDRGLYRRYRGGPATARRQDVPAGTSAPVTPAPISGALVVLVGCSRTKADAPAPAPELFQG